MTLEKAIKELAEDRHDAFEVLFGEYDNLYNPTGALVKQVEDRNYEVFTSLDRRYKVICNNYNLRDKELKPMLMNYELNMLRNKQ